MIKFLNKIRLRNFGTTEFVRYCWTHLFRKKKRVPADEEGVPYGEHKDQSFDVWYGTRKDEEGGAPVLIFFHGGAFIKKHRFYSKLMRQSHAEGVTVIAAGYRLSSSKRFTIEDSIEDSARLVRFLKQNAVKFGINPDRIAVSGNSAGGCIALSLAVRKEILGEGEDNEVVCAAVHNAPTLLDPLGFRQLMGLPSIEPLWYLWSKLFNVAEQDDLETERVQAIIEKTSPHHHVSASSAPMYLDYSKAPPEGGKHSYDERMVDILHSAKFGEFFIDLAEECGADVKLSHPSQRLAEKQVDFLLDHLGVERGTEA